MPTRAIKSIPRPMAANQIVAAEPIKGLVYTAKEMLPVQLTVNKETPLAGNPICSSKSRCLMKAMQVKK